jgi:hypothetical protein
MRGRVRKLGASVIDLLTYISFCNNNKGGGTGIFMVKYSPVYGNKNCDVFREVFESLEFPINRGTIPGVLYYRAQCRI